MTQYRILGLVAVVLVLCSLAAGGGSVVGTWRAEAKCAELTKQLRDKVSALVTEKQALELAIADQNKAVAVAEATTKVAMSAKAKAEQHAAELAAFSASRMAKLEKVVKDATSCDAVLRKYWELRQ